VADIELSNGICVSVDSDSRFRGWDVIPTRTEPEAGEAGASVRVWESDVRPVQWALEDRADLVSCAGCGRLHAVAERVDCECGAVILSPAAFYGVADR
jgi:hypothetical protein